MKSQVQEVANAVAGVVVLYNPDESVLDHIASYIGSLDRLFVVDNSEVANQALHQSIIQQFPKASLIVNQANLGIARALNIGAEAALAREFEWLLTMDQDSKASPAMMKDLVQYAKSYPDGTIGIVAPTYTDKNTPATTPVHEAWQEISTVITSGNLLSLKAYRQVGPFEDKFFIDYVDHEYCLRLRKHGFRIVQVNTATLYHQQGNIGSKKVFSHPVFFSNHNATRRYYITRNRLYVMEKYGKDFPEFLKLEVSGIFKEFVKIIFFEDSKLQKLKSIWKGYWHYKQRRFGKL